MVLPLPSIDGGCALTDSHGQQFSGTDINFPLSSTEYMTVSRSPNRLVTVAVATAAGTEMTH